MVNVYLRGQGMPPTGKISPMRYLLERDVDGSQTLKWFTAGLGRRTETFQNAGIVGQQLARMADKSMDYKLSIITNVDPKSVVVDEDWPSDRPADTFDLTKGNHYILDAELNDVPVNDGDNSPHLLLLTLSGDLVPEEYFGDDFALGHEKGKETRGNIKLSNVSISNDSVERLRVNQVDGDALDFEKTSLDDILSLIKRVNPRAREGEIELMIESVQRHTVPGPTTHRWSQPQLLGVERWNQMIREDPTKWAFIYNTVQRRVSGVPLEEERARLVRERDGILRQGGTIQRRQYIWIQADDAIAIIDDSATMRVLVENHSDIDWSPTEGELDRALDGSSQISVGGAGRKRKYKRKSKKRKTRKSKRRTRRRRRR